MTFVYLGAASNGQRICGNIVGNGGAGGGICTVAYVYRGDQVGIASNEGVITNDGAGFGVTIVVDCDSAAAKIDVFANIGVTYISQVGDFGVISNGGIF